MIRIQDSQQSGVWNEEKSSREPKNQVLFFPSDTSAKKVRQRPLNEPLEVRRAPPKDAARLPPPARKTEWLVITLPLHVLADVSLFSNGPFTTTNDQRLFLRPTLWNETPRLLRHQEMDFDRPSIALLYPNQPFAPELKVHGS